MHETCALYEHTSIDLYKKDGNTICNKNIA